MGWRDLRLRVRALLWPRRVERELDEELAFHLERDTQKHMAAGASREAARARARARFGSVVRAAEACRDVRGTGVIDSAVRDLHDAWRAFRRAPGAALTIIGTVALGLGLIAAAFTIFSTFVLRRDAVRDPDSLVSIERVRTRGASERSRFTRRQFESLRRDTVVFSDAFARLMDVTSRIDGRMMEGQLVTGNFFDVVGVRAAVGRTLTVGDDLRSGPSAVIVLSHSGWSRWFAADPNVVGRNVVINGAPYQIVGVTPEGFHGLAFSAPDFWAPLSLVGQIRPWLAGREDSVGIDVVGRLKPGVSKTAARTALTAWAPEGITVQAGGTAVPLSPGVLLAFSPLFFAFGSILMIGCANVANLLLARAVARQREIGIRLSLGAPRSRVIRQLLSESLLLALVSAVCAFALSRIVLIGAISALVRTMPPEFAEFVTLVPPRADWRLSVFLLVAATVSTAAFALLPALRATRLDLRRTIRGEIIRDGRPGRVRNALIVVQVVAAAVLLICAAVFLRSASRAAARDPGIRVADTILVEVVNEKFRVPMIAAVHAEPAVTAVAAAWPGGPLSRPRAAFVTATSSRERTKLPLAYRFVSANYGTVLGIDVVKGRSFTDAEAAAKSPVAILSESSARELWPDGDALGQTVRVEPDRYSATGGVDEPKLSTEMFTVIGVVRDVAGFRLAGYSEAGLYIPAPVTMPEMDLIARVQGDPDRGRRALLDRLTGVDPNMGQVITLRTIGRLETYPLQVAFWLTMILGGLALALTLSGVFSVLSFLVEQRTKEIGVRLALGATTRMITQLMLSQSLRVVGIGLVLGGALAVLVAMALMATPAAARIGGIVSVFDPVAYLASLLCIVLACVLAASIPALRAARIDPIATLRHE